MERYKLQTKSENRKIGAQIATGGAVVAKIGISAQNYI